MRFLDRHRRRRGMSAARSSPGKRSDRNSYSGRSGKFRGLSFAPACKKAASFLKRKNCGRAGFQDPIPRPSGNVECTAEYQKRCVKPQLGSIVSGGTEGQPKWGSNFPFGVLELCYPRSTPIESFEL